MSKTAIRSDGLTKSGPDLSVTACTKAVMALLLGPSFQDDNGSLVARAAVVKRKNSRHEHVEITRNVEKGIFFSVNDNVRNVFYTIWETSE